MTKRELHQSDESYKKTIVELKRRSDSGVRIRYYDCEDTGAKNTECTVGLCDDSIQEMQDGIYRAKHHVCPHDGRYVSEHGQVIEQKEMRADGCFYHCHIFKKHRLRSAGERINAIHKRACQ